MWLYQPGPNPVIIQIVYMEIKIDRYLVKFFKVCQKFIEYHLVPEHLKVC